MSTRNEILDALGAQKVHYELVSHPPVSRIEDCKWAEEQLGGVMPKNLFLTPRNRSVHVLCLVQPDVLFRTADVSKQLGLSRLSFAPEDVLFEKLRTYPGAISPMGLLFPGSADVLVAIDERLLQKPMLLFHPNDSAETLAMSGADFFQVFLPATGHAFTPIKIS